MKKYLTRQGNSAALVIDKPLLEATGITAETQLEVSTNGDVIILNPVRDAARIAAVKAIVDDAHARYAGVFQRLAK
jgi:antitoxin component of MazEF toxin-antitoxin module